MKTTVNVKVEAKTKKDASKLAHELGLTLSAVINANLKDFIRNKGLNISTEPQKLKQSVYEELKKIDQDIRDGKNLSPAFNKADDLIKYLKLDTWELLLIKFLSSKF